MWVVPEITGEFVERMEGVLRVYTRPYDPKQPVVCLDEHPVALREPSRPSIPMRPGRPRRSDYEYVRKGTANVFCVVEPKTGRRLTRATRRRTNRDFARMLRRISRAYPKAKRIHLVADNLSTHSEKACIETFGDAAVARFDDILIQDGSSFALKKALSEVFSGRFTTVEAAAVEVHATYSGFSDEVSTGEIAADSEQERQFLPDPATLAGHLLLADRGYPSTTYFDEVDKHGGSFIDRLSRSHDPWVNAAWLDGKRLTLRTPIRLSQFIAQHTGRRMDLDVEYNRGKQAHEFRVMVLPGNELSMTRLCTNLPRTPFSLDLVSRLYRFRWQVELLFKEWKSYANLQKFNTANEHIAAGLIWASLCAAVLKRFLAHAAQIVGGKPISTRRVAMCAGHIIDELVAALLACASSAEVFRDGVAFLLANARRANPKRDRKVGRLRSGLVSMSAETDGLPGRSEHG